MFPLCQGYYIETVHRRLLTLSSQLQLSSNEHKIENGDGKFNKRCLAKSGHDLWV